MDEWLGGSRLRLVAAAVGLYCTRVYCTQFVSYIYLSPSHLYVDILLYFLPGLLINVSLDCV